MRYSKRWRTRAAEKLLDQLHKSNGQTLGELSAHLDMTRQAVTKHLLLLEGASLVVVVWRGARESCITSIQCRFTRSPSAGLANMNAIRLQALGDLKKNLEEKKKG